MRYPDFQSCDRVRRGGNIVRGISCRPVTDSAQPEQKEGRETGNGNRKRKQRTETGSRNRERKQGAEIGIQIGIAEKVWI